jgi:hypothetical protein
VETVLVVVQLSKEAEMADGRSEIAIVGCDIEMSLLP